ncbi:MAG: hypothetical protein AAF591_07080 [Verrucomicrobiota bacterium]
MMNWSLLRKETGSIQYVRKNGEKVHRKLFFLICCMKASYDRRFCGFRSGREGLGVTTHNLPWNGPVGIDLYDLKRLASVIDDDIGGAESKPIEREIGRFLIIGAGFSTTAVAGRRERISERIG